MFKHLKTLLKQFLFWLFVFAFSRFIYIVTLSSNLKSADWLAVLKSFIYALPLDISTASYIIAIIIIILFFNILFPINLWKYFILIYSILLIIPTALIYSGEIVTYPEWGAKLNAKIFVHLRHISEPIKTASNKHIFYFFSILCVHIASCSYIYIKWFLPKDIKLPFSFFKRLGLGIIWLIILIPLLILGLRGGIQPIPISQSEVYFSKNTFVNDATVNSIWNLGHSMRENRHSLNENPYVYLLQKTAEEIVADLYQIEKDTFTQVLDTSRPNIVFIILEGWSADIMNCLNGRSDGVTLFFDSLSKEGILFTNCYASGWTSDLGATAILASYPAMPIASIILNDDKARKIKAINQTLRPYGYHSSYVFGGDLNYGNIKSFLYNHQFDLVIEEDDFPSETPSGNLGIHDEYTLNYHAQILNTFPEPFLSIVFTLSSHSPYDMPTEKVITYGDDENQYLNSVYYADQSLKKYFGQIKKEKWYDNTLFILVADHGHMTPSKFKHGSKEHQRIPMLWYGNVLKENCKGSQISRLCSQTDILATLLSQLNIQDTSYRWSENIFNPYTKEFAFYIYYDGFGYITPNGYFSFENRYKRNFHENFPDSSKTEQITKEGQAYMQTLFEEYLSY